MKLMLMFSAILVGAWLMLPTRESEAVSLIVICIGIVLKMWRAHVLENESVADPDGDSDSAGVSEGF